MRYQPNKRRIMLWPFKISCNIGENCVKTSTWGLEVPWNLTPPYKSFHIAHQIRIFSAIIQNIDDIALSKRFATTSSDFLYFVLLASQQLYVSAPLQHSPHSTNLMFKPATNCRSQNTFQNKVRSRNLQSQSNLSFRSLTYSQAFGILGWQLTTRGRWAHFSLYKT